MRIKNLLLFTAAIALAVACKKDGCTDQAASNYDDNANNDDGSCQYDGTGGGGTGGGNSEDPDYNLAGNTGSPITITDVYENSSAVDYYVDGTWNINAAVTIEPGVRILMKAGARINVNSNGSLDASGNSADKIYFVGEQDVEGYWLYIQFDGSNNPNNKLNHVVVKNAGSSSTRPASVYVRGNSRLQMQNTTVSTSESNGLEVNSSDGKLIDFENNYFTKNGLNAIKVNNLTQASDIDFNTDFDTDNVYNRVYISGGDVNQASTLSKVQGPFYLAGTTRIYADMQITEGTEIHMGPGAAVNVYSAGSLNITGTPSERVTIKGGQEVEGFWSHIQYDDSNNPNNVIEYTDISHGGSSSTRPANLYLRQSAQVTMSNSSSNYSQSYGVNGTASATFNDGGGNTYEGNQQGDNTYN